MFRKIVAQVSLHSDRGGEERGHINVFPICWCLINVRCALYGRVVLILFLLSPACSLPIYLSSSIVFSRFISKLSLCRINRFDAHRRWQLYTIMFRKTEQTAYIYCSVLLYTDEWIVRGIVERGIFPSLSTLLLRFWPPNDKDILFETKFLH